MSGLVAVDDLRTKRVRVALMKMLIDTAFSVLPQFAMILIIVVGAERVADGILAPGDLVQAVALFGVLSFPMQVIGFFLTDLPVTVVGRRRVDALLGAPDDPLGQTPANAPSLPPGPLGAHLAGVLVGEPERPRITGLIYDRTRGDAGPRWPDRRRKVDCAGSARPASWRARRVDRPADRGRSR